MSRCETVTRRSDTERGGRATASTYLQGAEAGAPRHRYLEQSDEHHSFVRSRHRSSASPPSCPVSPLTTTSARLALVATSRPPRVCCCPVSSPSTPVSARARRPSPSTRAPDKPCCTDSSRKQTALFRATHFFTKEYYLSVGYPVSTFFSRFPLFMELSYDVTHSSRQRLVRLG